MEATHRRVIFSGISQAFERAIPLLFHISILTYGKDFAKAFCFISVSLFAGSLCAPKQSRTFHLDWLKTVTVSDDFLHLFFSGRKLCLFFSSCTPALQNGTRNQHGSATFGFIFSMSIAAGLCIQVTPFSVAICSRFVLLPTSSMTVCLWRLRPTLVRPPKFSNKQSDCNQFW